MAYAREDDGGVDPAFADKARKHASEKIAQAIYLFEFQIDSRQRNSNVIVNVYQMLYFCTKELISNRMVKKSFQSVNFITQYGYALISADSDHQMVIRQIIS